MGASPVGAEEAEAPAMAWMYRFWRVVGLACSRGGATPLLPGATAGAPVAADATPSDGALVGSPPAEVGTP